MNHTHVWKKVNGSLWACDCGATQDASGDVQEALFAQNIRVSFLVGYNGGVNARVTIGDETDYTKTYGENEGKSKGIEYILDLDWLTNHLVKEIEEKGYTVSQTKRQKYPRIIINS